MTVIAMSRAEIDRMTFCAIWRKTQDHKPANSPDQTLTLVTPVRLKRVGRENENAGRGFER